MRKIALLSASALILALGVATASAQPNRDLATGVDQTPTSNIYVANPKLHEGRAAATEFQHQGIDLVITEKHGVR
jgi:hypothetical protein